MRGIQMVEATTKSVSANSLRALRKLYTPEARAAIMVAFSARRCTLKDMEKEIEKASLTQWVDFHWQPQNELLDKSLRMPQPPHCYHTRGCKR